MAQSVVAVPPPEVNWPIVGALAGALTAILVPFFTWLSGRRKNDIDESAIILTKYKELADTFRDQVVALQSQFDQFRATSAFELEGLRERLASSEASSATEIKGLRDRLAVVEQDNRNLREENSGLKSAIRQNSQSGAYLLERNTPPDTASRAGDNIRSAATDKPA